MNLRDYMDETEQDAATMARLLGVHQTAISKWVTGKRIPRRAEMQKIYEVTDGKVAANDFYHE